MGYVLRPGLSFCEASGRLIFLDIVADRYFCLGPTSDVAFRALLSGRIMEAQAIDLALLGQSGLLLETAGAERPRSCPTIPVATMSLLDRPVSAAGPGSVLRALGGIMAARVRLRRHGLENALSRLQCVRDRARPDAPADMAPAGLAVAFARTTHLIRSHDQCLPRSIALADQLLRAGWCAQLIIGVAARPFQAHAWVQLGEQLVNDHVERVRIFTPILRL